MFLECQVYESRQIGSGQTGDGKSERQHSRNQWTEMEPEVAESRHAGLLQAQEEPPKRREAPPTADSVVTLLHIPLWPGVAGR